MQGELGSDLFSKVYIGQGGQYSADLLYGWPLTTSKHPMPKILKQISFFVKRVCNDKMTSLAAGKNMPPTKNYLNLKHQAYIAIEAEKQTIAHKSSRIEIKSTNN